MEARKITIVTTSDQTTTVINSAATTLAELKRDLANAHINYNNLTFFEGKSKTEICTDASVLPHDVPYKGDITNELVFLLSPKDKIKNGAISREDIYSEIRSKGLEKLVEQKFGKNFTNCKTSELLSVLEDVEEAAKNSTPMDRLLAVLINYGVFDPEDATFVVKGVVKPSSGYSKEELDEMFDFVNNN